MLVSRQRHHSRAGFAGLEGAVGTHDESRIHVDGCHGSPRRVHCFLCHCRLLAYLCLLDFMQNIRLFLRHPKVPMEKSSSHATRMRSVRSCVVVAETCMCLKKMEQILVDSNSESESSPGFPRSSKRSSLLLLARGKTIRMHIRIAARKHQKRVLPGRFSFFAHTAVCCGSHFVRKNCTMQPTWDPYMTTTP